ncbi:hypothetical protein [Streptomyces sp. NPDC051554]|uniref:hypothetical protein n=1 Tax=Streptomyces sp. NPDC051554 TaxID=3365656 RepID=UPI00379E9614
MMTFAERVGLTREQAASLVHGGPADECWTSERERLLILAVDALHERSDIDDALWTRLVSVFDELQLLDLLLLCGWYHAVSFAARAARARRASLRRPPPHHDRDQPIVRHPVSCPAPC